MTEEKAPEDIQGTWYKMYNEMYNLAKYVSNETTAPIIQQRFFNEEVQTAITYHLTVTDWIWFMVNAEKEENRIDKVDPSWKDLFLCVIKAMRGC